MVKERILASRDVVEDLGQLPCGLTVLDPGKSQFLVVWDVLIGIVLCFVAVGAPYETVFVTPEFGLCFLVNRLIDAVFFADMLLQFVTAQEDPHHPGVYERQPHGIARIYFHGWFIIDFLSVLPVDIICVLSESNASLGWLSMPRFLRNVKVLRLLRLTRLLRLAKVKKLVVRWQSAHSISFAAQSLVQFLVMIAIVSHWMACLWASLAWPCENADNWISRLEMDRGGEDIASNPFYVYCVSLYWAVMTLTSIGYGDIVATTHLEYVVATMCMLFMAGIWAYTIGAVCGIVGNLHPHEVAFKRMLDTLNSMMADNGMPHDVRTRLRKYVYASRSVNRKKVEAHAITSLSPMLQGELLLYGNKDFLMAVPCFVELSHEELVCTAHCLDARVYAPTEYIHQEKTLFIVQQGLCVRMMAVHLPKMYWGQGNLILSNPLLWDAEGAYALTHVQVLTLQATELNVLMDRFPTAREAIKRARMFMGVARATQLMKDLEKEVTQSRWKDAWNQLEEDGRLLLWTDLLKGRFRAPMLLLYVPSQLDVDWPDDVPTMTKSPSRHLSRKITVSATLRQRGDFKKLTPEQDAKRVLGEAVSTRNVQQLRFALQRAMQVDLDGPLVDRAERALQEEMMFERFNDLSEQIHCLRTENTEMRAVVRSRLHI